MLRLIQLAKIFADLL